MRKRATVVAIVIVLVGGAYAAGAAVSSTSGTASARLRRLRAVSSGVPQVVKVRNPSNPPTNVAGARLRFTVRTGHSGVVDLRFSGVADEGTHGATPLNLDLLVDGVPVVPAHTLEFVEPNSVGPFAVERVAAALAVGTHVVTVQLQDPLAGEPPVYVTLDGWTLIAEEAEAG